MHLQLLAIIKIGTVTDGQPSQYTPRLFTTTVAIFVPGQMCKLA
jgi:hypothetical protein